MFFESDRRWRLALQGSQPVKQHINFAVNGSECVFRRDYFNIRDVPVLDAAFPDGEALPHQRTMLRFIESHDVAGGFEINRSALKREALSGLRDQTAVLQSLEREWRKRPNVVCSSLDSEPARLRPPRQRYLRRSGFDSNFRYKETVMSSCRSGSGSRKGA